jgi:hypothetical protein
MTNAYIISVTESEERYFLGTIGIEIRVVCDTEEVGLKVVNFASSGSEKKWGTVLATKAMHLWAL